jgi:hypothetical protein
MEHELPQLREMVLQNTERINKNEMMINKLRMENVQQSRKISEHEDFFREMKESHREFDKRLKEGWDQIAEREKKFEKWNEEEKARIKERNEEFEKWNEEEKARIKERNEEFDKRLEEFDKRLKAGWDQIAEREKKFEKWNEEEKARIKKRKEEFEKYNKEEWARIREINERHEKEIEKTWAQIKETDKQLKETSYEVKQLSRRLTGTTGHIVEGLVSSSAAKIFKKAGFELHDSGKNLKRKHKIENLAMGVDVMLSNETTAVPIEVKANFTKEDVNRFLHQMELFRRLFPECSGKEVFAAVAAINYEEGVAEHAHEKGLLVIRVSSDDIFSLDPVEKAKLHKY